MNKICFGHYKNVCIACKRYLWYLCCCWTQSSPKTLTMLNRKLCCNRKYCWKWPTATFPITSVCTRWRSYLSSSLRSDGLLTAQTLNSLDNSMCSATWLSRYTRAQTCRPRAVIGRQRLSLRSSRLWARKRPGFDWRRRTPERRQRVRTPKRPVQNDVTVRNDVAVPNNEVAARPVRRHRRWAVEAAAGSTRRPPSYRRRRGIIGSAPLRCAAPAATDPTVMVTASSFMSVPLLG